MQPLVMTALGNATQSWNAILGSLPDTLSGEQQALLDAIQAFMEQAKALGNPIAANGALRRRSRRWTRSWQRAELHNNHRPPRSAHYSFLSVRRCISLEKK
jgi:hypothetical protein